MFKVRVSEVDRERFPFPVFYLFRPDELQVLRSAFDVLLCFQVRLYLPTVIANMYMDGDVGVGDDAIGETYDALNAHVPGLLSNEEKWQIGIPILTTNRSYGLSPAFLGNTDGLQKGRYRNEEFKRGAAEDFGYLIRGSEVIKPPCLACPHILMHDAGQCRLGDTRCYNNLVAYIEGASYEHKSKVAVEDYARNHREDTDDGAVE